MRRKAREIAVQSLFQSEFAPQLSLKEMISATELADYDSESIKFAEELLAGIKDKRPQIDSRIQAASQHWKLERMAVWIEIF